MKTYEELLEEISRLKNSEKKYRNMVENANESICVARNGFLTFVNKKMSDLLIYSKEELTSKPFTSFIHEDDRLFVLNKYKSRLNGNIEPEIYDFRVIKKDKSVIWVQISSNIIDWDNEVSTLNYLTDITDRKLKEEELKLKTIKLKESEEIFFKVFESSPDGIFLSDINGNYIDVNPYGCNMLKYTKEEILSKNMRDLISKEDLNINPLRMNDLKSGNNVYSERKLICGDGSLIDVEISGKLLSDGNLLGIVRDITSSKKERNELLENKEKFLKIFNSSPDLLILTRLSNGEIIDVNEKFLTHTKHNKEDIIGKNTLGINLWANPSDRNDYVKLLNENKFVRNREYDFKLKSGEIRNALVSANILEINSESCVLGTIRDITDFNQIQQDLHDREEIYSSIVNQANDSIALVDIETAKFLEFNETAYKSLGYTNEEFKELTVKDIDAISSSKDISDSFDFFKENKNGIFETKHKSKTGEIRDVRVSTKYLEIKGKPYLSTIWSDISESKCLSNALEDKNNFLELVINTIPNQLFWKDENLIYQGCNKVFSDIIGLNDPKDIVGLTDFDLKRKNDYSKSYINDDLKVIEEGKEILNIEEKYFNKQGEEGVVLTSKVPIKSSNNKVIGILGICIDITENKKIEDQIKKLNESLQEKVEERTLLLDKANKDLESFAYSVSHDLRAPIRHIDAFSKILHNSIKNNISEEYEKYFTKINNASSKMSNMIDDLLKFSRLGRKSLEKTNVDLNVLVKDIIEQYKADIGDRKIEFIIGNLPNIIGDKNLLQIVFENLISNAIKFTSKKEFAIIEINQCKKLENQCTIYIRDNGVGFDMNYVDKLFGVFQRLHSENEFSGTGIGLANIKQIIQKHGGTIYVEAEVDKGAIFYLSL